MTQTAPHISLNGSRLLRYLTDLAVSDVQLNHKDFALKLGQLIGFSDSFTLAEKLDAISKQEPTSFDASKSVIKQFMASRKALIEAIISSDFPLPIEDDKKEENKGAIEADSDGFGFAPYLRYYTARQREMELKIQPLHTKVRNGLKDVSNTLAQLCALDSAMGELLNGYQRKSLGVIPRLLEQRFNLLLVQYQEQADAGAQQELYNQAEADTPQSALAINSDDKLESSEETEPAIASAQATHACTKSFLQAFKQETQGLLLAELELRLLPTLGLIEALNEHKEVDKAYD